MMMQLSPFLLQKILFWTQNKIWVLQIYYIIESCFACVGLDVVDVLGKSIIGVSYICANAKSILLQFFFLNY